MRRAKCEAENREGRKFCAKCAAPLSRLCPKCGAANEPGEDFCGECATPLGQPSAASVKKSNDAPIRITETPVAENIDGERKTVTALFADIKGSMELMEDLDPEEARAIVDPALKLMMDAVHHYSGYVAQSTATGSSRYSAHQWRTKTIRSGRFMRRFGCKTTCAASRPSCARPATYQSRPASG